MVGWFREHNGPIRLLGCQAGHSRSFLFLLFLFSFVFACIIFYCEIQFEPNKFLAKRARYDHSHGLVCDNVPIFGTKVYVAMGNNVTEESFSKIFP